MRTEITSFIKSCVSLMLDPVAEFCISRGFHFQDFVEAAKGSFVKAARRKLDSEALEVSTSKLSVMTGIQRPEINRLVRVESDFRSRDFVTRIVGQWVSDKRFLDAQRKPKRLSIEGRGSEFSKLVSLVSRDLSPHTVRFELERLQLIECSTGRARLLRDAYISSGDSSQILEFGAEDTRDLLNAVQENAFSSNSVPNLHARTQYDNVPDEALPEVRGWFLELGHRIHEECRKFLSKFDRDINPKLPPGSGRNRVILGTFSNIESVKRDRVKSEEVEP